MKTLVTFELEYRKNKHVYVCRIGVRGCRTYLSCYRVYICGIFRIYLGYCRIYIVGVFAVYLYVGLSYTCLWYFPYIDIHLDYCRKAHTGIYIWTICANRYIFVVLPYTYWSCFRRYLSCCRNIWRIADILVVLWYIFVFVGSHRFLRSKHFSFVMVNINSINIWICSLVQFIHGCTSTYCSVVSNMKKGSFSSQWCWHCWKFQAVVCCVSFPLWLNKIQKWKFKNQALVAWFAKFSYLEKRWFVKIPKIKFLFQIREMKVARKVVVLMKMRVKECFWRRCRWVNIGQWVIVSWIICCLWGVPFGCIWENVMLYPDWFKYQYNRLAY